MDTNGIVRKCTLNMENSGGHIGLLASACFVAFSLDALGNVDAAEDLQQLTILLGDYRFEPDTIEVSVKRPVHLTLVNEDLLTPHNFTLKTADASLRVDANVSAGTSVLVSFTPEIPGTYAVYCAKKLPLLKSHRERGMEGKLIVKAEPSACFVGGTLKDHVSE